MNLLHGRICPECGKEWEAEGDLVPNVKDREFYGGRIKFFKEVICDCDKRYVLLIGRKDTREGTIEYPVIDIAYNDGDLGLESLKNEHKTLEQNVLSAMVDIDVKRQKLSQLTANQIRKALTDRGIKFKVKDSKTDLIKKLLEKDPNVVVAQLD